MTISTTEYFSFYFGVSVLQNHFAGDDFYETGKFGRSPGEMYDPADDEVEMCKPVIFLTLMFPFMDYGWCCS